MALINGFLLLSLSILRVFARSMKLMLPVMSVILLISFLFFPASFFSDFMTAWNDSTSVQKINLIQLFLKCVYILCFTICCFDEFVTHSNMRLSRP